jgi:hypothetical protein
VNPGYGLDDRFMGVRFSEGAGNFPLPHQSKQALGPTQLPMQMVPGTLSQGVKRPWSEADHSHPPTAEVKERVELYFHHQYVLMA